VTTVQPIPTNTVIIQQQRRKPENYMVFAILVTIFCNCPLGTLAWIFSCLSDSSYDEGNEAEARKRGKAAMWLSIAGIIVTVALIIIIPAALVGAVADGISDAIDSNRYCGKNFWGTYGCYDCKKCMAWWSPNHEKNDCKQTC